MNVAAKRGLRRKLAREPQIHGGKKSRVVFTEDAERSEPRTDRRSPSYTDAMATMNPVLRIRRAVGFDDDQSDEVVTALEDQYPNRRESEERMARLMAEQRNQFLLGVLIIVSIAVAVIVALN